MDAVVDDVTDEDVLVSDVLVLDVLEDSAVPARHEHSIQLIRCIRM